MRATHYLFLQLHWLMFPQRFGTCQIANNQLLKFRIEDFGHKKRTESVCAHLLNTLLIIFYSSQKTIVLLEGSRFLCVASNPRLTVDYAIYTSYHEMYLLR